MRRQHDYALIKRSLLMQKRA